MSKEILIQVQKGERLVAIIENGKLDDFQIEVDHQQCLLGNIYKGKVESILPSLNAAFVNIGQERNGFLYLTDAANPLIVEQESTPRSLLDKILQIAKPKKEKTASKNDKAKKEIPLTLGQEIIVQVVKDPFGAKGARLTTHITIPRRFIVYMPYDKQTGVSKKIENDEERKRLRDVMKSFTFAKSGGFIIRTVSHNQDQDELVKDAKVLYKTWLKILKSSEREKAPILLYGEGQLTWKIVRDYLTENVDKLIIDSEEEYDKIRKFAETLIGPEIVKKIEFYKGDVPLFEHKKVSEELKKIYETKVYVKSGAYVVIQPTEGLIVVDVNSGKFKPNASPAEAAFMTNMDVIPEIARQLRLRDLGGIIVIDFIDMSREEHKRKVLDALRNALLRDDAKTEVGRISSFGLVEMTRERTGKTIESISFGECPYCKGRGRVKTKVG